MKGASQLLSIFIPVEGKHCGLGLEKYIKPWVPSITEWVVAASPLPPLIKAPTLVDAFGRREDGANQRSNLPRHSLWVQIPQGRSTLDKQTK